MAKYHKYFVGILLILFFSCVNSEQKQFPEIFDEYYEFNISQNDDGLGMINHQPKYIGILKDTINIEHYLRPFNVKIPNGSKLMISENKFEKYFVEWNDKKSFKNLDSARVEIRIDTTQIISNENRKSYPVMFENHTKDTLKIGYGNVIPIITEAKLDNGKWKKIEKPYVYFCGVGVQTIILPPNEILITNQIIYNGNFKTKLRMRIGKNISQEFYGNISKPNKTLNK